MNELANNEMKPTPPGTRLADPYAAFANESGPGIVGRLLACRKGDWGIGRTRPPSRPRLASSLSFPRQCAVG